MCLFKYQINYYLLDYKGMIMIRFCVITYFLLFSQQRPPFAVYSWKYGFFFQNDNKEPSKKNPIIKLGDKLNPKKRKVDTVQNGVQTERNLKIRKIFERKPKLDIPPNDGIAQQKNLLAADKKKQEADKKRMESMQMKRQEFKNKQQIIKTGLIGIVSLGLLLLLLILIH